MFYYVRKTAVSGVKDTEDSLILVITPPFNAKAVLSITYTF